MGDSVSKRRVRLKSKVEKDLKKLPSGVQSALFTLLREIEESGSIRWNWSNYGKLKPSTTRHHCHIKKGQPTYVACWEEVTKNQIEVYYVGTHEKAPY